MESAKRIPDRTKLISKNLFLLCVLHFPPPYAALLPEKVGLTIRELLPSIVAQVIRFSIERCVFSCVIAVLKWPDVPNTQTCASDHLRFNIKTY